MAPVSKPGLPLSEAIRAAIEFKLLLDVQPAGSLFNPGGKGDARESASYAHASALLLEATAERLHGADSPGVVHGSVVTVVDVVANHRANMPSDLLELLAGVAIILGKLGFEISHQDRRSSEQGCSLKAGVGTAGNSNVVIEKIKGQIDAVHEAASGKVVGQTLCHGQELVRRLMDSAFSAESNRTQRSGAYKEGACDYVFFKATGQEASCAFAPGAAEFDAYFAGMDEGRSIWSRHLAEGAK